MKKGQSLCTFTKFSERSRESSEAAIDTSCADLSAKQQPNAPFTPTVEALITEAQALLPPSTNLPDDFETSVGEVFVLTIIVKMVSY